MLTCSIIKSERSGSIVIGLSMRSRKGVPGNFVPFLSIPHRHHRACGRTITWPKLPTLGENHRNLVFGDEVRQVLSTRFKARLWVNFKFGRTYVSVKR